MLNQSFINNSTSDEMQMRRSNINQELTNFLCKNTSRNLTNEFQSIHSGNKIFLEVCHNTGFKGRLLRDLRCSLGGRT